MSEIFVFGSNLAGWHGKGAALEAVRKHGAVYGKGIGWHGNSYAIPTKDERLRTLPLSVIEGHVYGIPYHKVARGHLPAIESSKPDNAALTLALRNSAPELIEAAEREEKRNRREGTHAADCHLWGPRHYDCLMREYEKAAKEQDELRARAEKAETDAQTLCQRKEFYANLADEKSRRVHEMEKRSEETIVALHIGLAAAQARIAELVEGMRDHACNCTEFCQESHARVSNDCCHFRAARLAEIEKENGNV